MTHVWRALRHRNFRLYVAGQGVSVMGTWMTRLAATWLVYRLTHSVWMLGVIGFSGQMVSLLLGPLAGVWVERLERKRLLIWTQAGASLQALALAALTLSGKIELWEILALTVFQGVINAFDMPGRQSFLVQLVGEPEDLSNAIAINSLLANGARLLGPALAGGIVATVGEGWCFLIDGVSYLAVIVSLLAMHALPGTATHAREGLWAEMREGWTYVCGQSAIRTLLLVFSLVSLLGYPVTVLLPAFAGDVLRGGAQTLGWLAAAAGLGTMLSTLLLAARRSVVGLPRMLERATLLLGAGLVAFGASRWFWFSAAAMAVVGFGLMQSASVCNTLLQSLVQADKRARVMSYYTMAFFGGAPVGSLLLSGLAERAGCRVAVLFSGVCCALSAVWLRWHLGEMNVSLQEGPNLESMGHSPGSGARTEEIFLEKRVESGAGK